MLVAIDVDSTLHDYWLQFSAAAMALHGVDLPYADQLAWSVDALTPEQLSQVIEQTHDDAKIAEAVPYPGAVGAIQGWKAAGHEILITTHRRPGAYDATARWLNEQAIPFDQLRCGWEKVEHCRLVGAGLLIDDSPDNLVRALAADIQVATIRHPWNADVIAEYPDVFHGEDWTDLADTLGKTVLRPRQDR